MTGIPPVGKVDAAAPPDPSDDSSAAELQQAFSTGIVQFMGTVLQSSEGDLIDAINDNTSDPDAPS